VPAFSVLLLGLLGVKGAAAHVAHRRRWLLHLDEAVPYEPAVAKEPLAAIVAADEQPPADAV